MLFIRPSELFPAMGDVQVYLAFIVLALLFSIQGIHNQVQWKSLIQQPVNLCVIAVTICVALSRLSTGNFDKIDTAVIGMLKVTLYYLVLVSVITSPLRLRYFLMSTAICSTLMIAYSVVDYRSFNAEWLNNPNLEQVLDIEHKLPPDERTILRHIPDRNGVDRYGNEIWFFRICGLGIFHDPNDLSLLIVVTSIISIYFLTDKNISLFRMLWILPLMIMAVAMYYTYSRGGLLAAMIAMFAWLCTRYGGKVALTIGALCAAAVPVALGRAANIDVSSGTGQQRIQIWSDGLMAIRNTRVIFGIGEGQYTEISTHVAHNSYVHAFVELGLVGGTFFFGCFFLPAFTFLLMKTNGFKIHQPELRRLFPYIAAMLACWCMGMCSLSRCYVPPTYMIAGICASFVNLVGFCRPSPRPLLILNSRTAQPWIACSFGVLICAYLFVRVFARFG
ncbi:O-antigen ligase family protein [Thalassoglobus sp.]|uniref:O-antigen ligase family protein n=1 Tax=Thalassoglobus sp. TaxID=2795869 RepID=UPI003AA94BBE